MKLNRVAGFDKVKPGETIKVDEIVKKINDRVEKSEKLRDECIENVVKEIKAKGYTLETAMKYFDSDKSGYIDRNELNEGFKVMRITLSEALVKNVFCILDKNNDNEISMLEFEEVFGKFLGTGGPVQEVKAE